MSEHDKGFRFYDIDLKAPVILTSSVGDETISLSENYISGTTLLGMFASRYLDQKGHSAADQHFLSWFLNGDLCFLNGHRSVTGLVDHEQRSLPAPRSWQVTKKAPENPADLLFKDEDDSIKSLEEINAPSNGDDAEAHGGSTDDTTKPFEGFIARTGNLFAKAEIEKAIALHHARRNQLYGPGTEGGQVFNYEYLKAGQKFRAAIAGEIDTVKEFLEWANGKNEQPFRIGRSKNTEYGLVELTWLPEDAGKQEVAHKPDFSEGENSISLTFLSHGILLNEIGQSTCDEKNLHNYLHFVLLGKRPDGDGKSGVVSIKKAYMRPVEIENYIAVWKARRPAQTAYGMGSCFLLEFDAEWLAENRESAVGRLTEMQQIGIGARRQEGFGRIVFGWQKQEPLTNDTKTAREKARIAIKDSFETESEAMPDMAKNILAKALRTRALEEVRTQAHRDAVHFSSSTLKGRVGIINRLLPMVETVADENAFLKEILEKLREPARTSLSKIRRNDPQQSLLDFLGYKRGDNSSGVTAMLKTNFNTANSEKIRQVLQFEFESDGFANMAYKEYLRTLFTTLQKRSKKEA